MSKTRGLTLDILIQAEGWDSISDLDDLCQAAGRAASAVVGKEKDQALEVSLALANDAAIRPLNQAYRGKDKATNVLSFPSEDEPLPGEPAYLGDVMLAYETMAREAQELEKPLEDHLCHLVIHGLLHLFGYDHEEDTEAEVMERLESAAMASLGRPDPYDT